MRKRALVAALMSIVGLLAVADTETINDIVWTYEKYGGVATITGAKTTAGVSVSGAIVSPGTLGNVTVENINYGVFYGCEGISSVAVSDGVKFIGDRAFTGCTGLQNVTLPSSTKTIGSEAFQGCIGLKTIDIPYGVVSIGSGAFQGCIGLETIDIPYGVVSIGGYAFSGCIALQTIDLPDSIYEIGAGAFYGCSAATSLHIPALLSGISESTFRECSSVVSVYIPDNVASIGNLAFADCSKLQDVRVGKKVASIGYSAFGDYYYGGCPNLEKMIFRGNAPTMRDYVFAYDGNTHYPNCTAYVKRSSTGWGVSIPGTWQGIKIDYSKTMTYMVSFDENGGTVVSGLRQCYIREGERIGEFPVVTREDYDLVGWYTAAEGGSEVTADTGVDDDLSCHARWTLTPPPVSLDFATWIISAGCSREFTARATLEDGSKREVAATWQVVGDNEFGTITPDGQFTAAKTVVDGSVTLKASYTSRGKTVTATKAIQITPKEILVHFVGNGGVPSVSNDTFIVYGKYGTLPTATWPGHSFDGWYTAADGGTKVLADSEVTDDECLYAHWSDLAPKALAIEGQASVSAGMTASYIAKATLTDDSQKEVSAVWSIISGTDLGSIDGDGQFTAAETSIAGQVTLKAVYAAAGAEAADTITVSVVPRIATVTFHGNGGSVSATSADYAIYGKYGELPSAERSGFVFAGWYTAAEGGELVGANSTVTDVRNLYAHWRNYRPSAILIGGADSVLAGESVRFSTFVIMENGETNDVEVTNVTWEIVAGDQFGILGESGELIASGIPESGEVIVKATYEAEGKEVYETKTVMVEKKTVLVSFEGNGGDAPDAQTYVVYGLYGSLPSPVRRRHAFGGWWTAADGGLEITSNSVVEASASRLFARWTPYEVVFDANGGTGVMGSQSFVSQATQQLEANAFAKDGYEFQGWARSPDGDVVWQDCEQITVDSPITLYAVWKVTYAVTYSPGAFGMEPEQTATKTEGVALTLADAIFTRPGYVQAGWATKDGGSKAYVLGAPYTANAALTLYPYWKAAYTVTYKPGFYGTEPEQTATKTKDVALTLAGAIFTRAGYTQTGWATSDGGTKAYDFGAAYAVNAALTLYPFWTADVPPPPVVYAVTYKPGANGTGSERSVVKTKDVALTLAGAIFTRAGYTQTGWAKSEGGSKAYDLGAAYAVNAALTLYPYWTKDAAPEPPAPVATTCTVKFNANGGSVSPTSRKVASGTAVGSLPKATRKGYTLKGWYTKKSGGTKIKSTTKVKKSITYYAQWTANKYKIKFDKNGGKGTMKTLSATYGKSVRLTANAFKKSKYKFTGWSKKKGGKVAYKDKAKVKNLTSTNGKTMTLYAVWKKSK